MLALLFSLLFILSPVNAKEAKRGYPAYPSACICNPLLGTPQLMTPATGYNSAFIEGYCCSNKATGIRSASGASCFATGKECYWIESGPNGGQIEKTSCPTWANQKAIGLSYQGGDCPRGCAPNMCQVKEENPSWLPFDYDYITCYEDGSMITGISTCGVGSPKPDKNPTWCDNGSIKDGAPDTIEDDCPDYDPNNEIPAPLSCSDYCEDEKGTGQYEPCKACVCDGEDNLTNNVWTEIGCITATEEGIIVAIMRVFFGVATSIAVLRFVQAAFMLNTDDPEKIKEGKSIMVSGVIALALAGSLIVLLNFIGMSILGIGNLV